MQAWREECRRINPDWEFKLWTKISNRQFVEENYPELLGLYDGYSQGIKRIDMVRLLYLHHFGGVYMDLDIACMKPFGNFFEAYPDKFILVNQFKNTRDYNNAVLASPPRHVIWEDAFVELQRNKDQNIIEATGGLLFQYHILPKEMHKGTWVEMPFDLFYAQDWHQATNNPSSICSSFDDCRTKFPHAITVHLGVATWKSKGDGSNRAWQDSKELPVQTNITVPPDIAAEIYVSGTYDKDFCYECMWHPGGEDKKCHRRLDFLIQRYKLTRRAAIGAMLSKTPQCRVPTKIDNNATIAENATTTTTSSS